LPKIRPSGSSADYQWLVLERKLIHTVHALVMYDLFVHDAMRYCIPRCVSCLFALAFSKIVSNSRLAGKVSSGLLPQLNIRSELYCYKPLLWVLLRDIRLTTVQPTRIHLTTIQFDNYSTYSSSDSLLYELALRIKIAEIILIITRETIDKISVFSKY
jgi:hypothetical protein